MNHLMNSRLFVCEIEHNYTNTDTSNSLSPPSPPFFLLITDRTPIASFLEPSLKQTKKKSIYGLD